MIFATALALVSALVASAADFSVTVGANNQLVFDPTSVNAKDGDTVHFEFVSKNHSVTQSTFASPCNPADDGIDSGFFSVSDANVHPVWSFKVNNASAPFWFYCAQKAPADHCRMGMVFALNPTTNKSFDAFQAAAKDGASGTTVDSAASQTPPGTVPSATTLTVISSGVPSSVESEFSAPSGSGFSTSGVEPTGTTSSAASNQGTNNAIGTQKYGSTTTVTLVSLFAIVARFVV